MVRGPRIPPRTLQTRSQITKAQIHRSLLNGEVSPGRGQSSRLILNQSVCGRARDCTSKCPGDTQGTRRGCSCCWLAEPPVRSTAVEVSWLPINRLVIPQNKCSGDLKHLKANRVGANYTDFSSYNGPRSVDLRIRATPVHHDSSNMDRDESQCIFYHHSSMVRPTDQETMDTGTIVYYSRFTREGDMP